jgi:hypothetical protein
LIVTNKVRRDDDDDNDDDDDDDDYDVDSLIGLIELS